EMYRELSSDRGPAYLKLTHLPESTISETENILHRTERPSRGTFHANLRHDYRTHDVQMHISDPGLFSVHSAAGVCVAELAWMSVPGLYAAGDLACVPHNYMFGAFVYGDIAAQSAIEHAAGVDHVELPADQVEAAHELIYRPLGNPDGPPQPQVE